MAGGGNRAMSAAIQALQLAQAAPVQLEIVPVFCPALPPTCLVAWSPSTPMCSTACKNRQKQILYYDAATAMRQL